MTLFTLFIVIALITQLSLGAEVLYQSSNNHATAVQMNLAGRTSAVELLNLIKDDGNGEASPRGFSSALSGGSMAMPDGFGGDLGGMGGFGDQESPEFGAGEGEGEREGEEESQFDSYQDPWAKPMRLQLGEFEVMTFVDDENGKFSLVHLSQKDVEKREEAIERVVRILDLLREDFDDDLSESEARAVTEAIVNWLFRDSRDIEWPAPERLSFDRLENEYLLLNSLEELMLVEGINANLFYDQVRDDDMIAPGLESVFTVYTLPKFSEGGIQTLENDAATEDDDSSIGDALSDDVASSDALDDPQASDDSLDNAVEGEGGLSGILGASSAVGLKININTAPRAVVQGLFPSFELPRVKSEAILEWRNEVDEEALAERDDTDEDYDDVELRESIFGVNEEEPKQVFTTLEDLNKVDGFNQEDIEAETQDELQTMLGVTSEIFSVYVYVRRNSLEGFEQERYYQEPPGFTLRLKAVVWRAPSEDGIKLVYLRDWHPVPYTRWRIPDFQRDLPPFRAQEYQ